MTSTELENAWKDNVVRRRRSDDAASLNTNFLSPTMNVNVTPRNRANLRRLKTNSLQSYKRWEKENELLYAMIEDLSDWLKKLFPDVVITAEFFFFALEDGSLLCRLANYIQEKANAFAVDRQVMVPGKTFRYNTPLKKGTKEQKLFRSRENVQLFLTWCRSHSIPEAILFESNDVVEVDECREGGREIVICLMDLARRFKMYNLDEVPQLIQMEQEIDQEEREEQDSNEQGQILDTQQPEATSPTSVDSDSGVDSVFDEDNAANRISEFSTDTTDGSKKGKNPSKQPELPSLLESTVPKSQLDEQVCKIAKDYNIKVVQRLKEGKYIILGRTMFVRMLNDHLLLRIGGGWDTLEHYLMTHVPKPGAESGTALSKGASPRTSWNAVKSRARLFEQGKFNGQTPKTENPQEPPAVVISKASLLESPESPSKSKPRRSLSVVQKDERDISEAIRKVSSTFLTQKAPTITNKTFFLLKKRFDKGLFGKAVRRRDSEPNLGEARQRKMAAFTMDGFTEPPKEINANEIGVKENGDVENLEFFVQGKATETSFSGDETQTTNAENHNELITIEDPRVSPLIDVSAAKGDDSALGDSSLEDISQPKESEGQELISLDTAPVEEKPTVEIPATGGDSLIAFEANNQVEASPAEDEFVGEEADATKLNSENEPERNVLEEAKPEPVSADANVENAKAVEEDEKAPDEGETPAESKIKGPKSMPEMVTEAKDDSSAKSEAKKEQPEVYTKKEPKVESKKEVKKDAAKTKTVESAKTKPKAAVAGRPKSPTKLPSKTETKKEIPKTGSVAKKESGVKSSVAKAPGAVKKPDPKKAAERPKSAAARPTTATKVPSTTVKAPAASQKKPAGAAPKPSAAVAPQKPATTRTTKAPGATGIKKPTEAAKPAASKARPQSAKPASKAADKTDGQAVGKPSTRPQSATAKPPASKKTTTSSGLAKPKTAATGVPGKATNNKSGKETKVASTSRAAKPDSGTKKAADGKASARPGSARPGTAKTSSAPTKAKVGAARPKTPVKATAPKGKDSKPAGSTTNKKPAAKKDTGPATGKKAGTVTSQKPSEAKPTVTEAVPNLESPPSEGVVRETKSETVEVEGDVVVRTVQTTREVVGPDGEKQITTTTEKVVEQTTGEVSSESPEEVQQVLSESAPNSVNEALADSRADEKSPENTDDTSQDRRTPTEALPSQEAPPSEKADEISPEIPDDTSEDRRTPTEDLPSQESPSVTETSEEVVKEKADENSPEDTSEDQPTPIESELNEESPPVAETSETVEMEGGTMTTTVVTTKEVFGPDGEREKTTFTETVVEEIDSGESQDVEAEPTE